jgi:hypothetical protein
MGQPGHAALLPTNSDQSSGQSPLPPSRALEPLTQSPRIVVCFVPVVVVFS